jgi:hypothetical protein
MRKHSMDLNTLNPQEIDTLEGAIRKLRQEEELKRLAAQKNSGPRAWKCTIGLRTRRNGQNNLPILCDGLFDAFAEAKRISAETGWPLVLVDGDRDFERESLKYNDAIFIIETVQDGCFGPVTHELPPRHQRLRERPPLAEYFAARG